MHGTSHFIGLDVHDVGLWHEPIQAGNVFTCEPRDLHSRRELRNKT